MPSKQGNHNKKHRKKKFNLGTYSKNMVTILLIVSLIDMQLSYILAFMWKEQVVQDLSQSIVTVLVATILGYLLKSFFETYSEKKNELMIKINVLENDETKDNEYENSSKDSNNIEAEQDKPNNMG